MKESDEPNFEFEKKIGIADCMYGDIPFTINMIGKLLTCMKESNKLNGKTNEFFRIDFRPVTFYESTQHPRGSHILDIKWGCKEENV